jgi:hypothetical protein
MTSDNLLRTDLVHEVNLFRQQGHWLADLDPNSTLYVLAFGAWHTVLQVLLPT